ncbi:cation diffusion facilitator family transporter [soil metagenome]
MTTVLPVLNGNSNPLEEQRLLKFSIGAVLGIALTSILFGLWSGSGAITFDGFYNLTDAGMTFVALLVSRLIARGDDERFQYGYWHLEPLVGFVSGSILAFTCAYAFVDGLRGLWAGGEDIAFGPGSIFVGAIAMVSTFMYFYISRAAAGIDSEFLKIDARGWLMGAVLSFSLCLSFLIGFALRASGFAQVASYVDPVVLLVAALCLVPFPIVTLWRAGQDILQIAPGDLNDQVREVARAVAAKHGFSDYTSHVARIGRQQFVEIGLVSPADLPAKSFQQLDLIRQEISKALGREGPGWWLTVDFTADKRWI